MENSDKQLRDKLNSNEFAFDPAAWGQMEAMLNGKKKRGGFFWWWTGGIAAALMCMLAGYEVHEFVGNKRVAQTQVQTTTGNNQQPVTLTEQNTTENNLNANQQAASNNAVTVPQETTTTINSDRLNKKRTNQQLNNSNNTTATGGSAQLSHSEKNKQVALKNNENKPSRNRKNKNAQKIKNTGFAGNTRSVGGRGLNKKMNGAGGAFANGNVNSGAVKTNAAQQEVIALNNAASAKLLSEEEQVIIDRMGVALLPIPTENTVIATEKTGGAEDLFPKNKKKIFNYSLGAAASVTGTTLGKQAAGVNAESSTSFFYNKPSYMAGFTHDFLFLNRVAITNSIMYSQTSFKVSAPKTVSYAKAPNSYTSTVKELAIPIGIKVYPVVKQGFNFYINTGIINHIKLQETFAYTVSPDTPVTNANTGAFDPYNFGLPNQTEFNSHDKSSDVLGVNGDPVPTTTSDFSINNAKRYYTSFYASAGVEFIVKNHWLFFVEPTFNMSLQKIGVQDKRKYNVGAMGGIRYKF